jgi:hypothetical protein
MGISFAILAYALGSYLKIILPPAELYDLAYLGATKRATTVTAS